MCWKKCSDFNVVILHELLETLLTELFLKLKVIFVFHVLSCSNPYSSFPRYSKGFPNHIEVSVIEFKLIFTTIYCTVTQHWASCLTRGERRISWNAWLILQQSSADPSWRQDSFILNAPGIQRIGEGGSTVATLAFATRTWSSSVVASTHVVVVLFRGTVLLLCLAAPCEWTPPVQSKWTIY